MAIAQIARKKYDIISWITELKEMDEQWLV
jgi:hypothetical protein